MYLVAVTPADEALLKEQVEEIVRKHEGDILRIRYDIGFDDDRNPEVNFRILLSTAFNYGERAKRRGRD